MKETTEELRDIFQALADGLEDGTASIETTTVNCGDDCIVETAVLRMHGRSYKVEVR